MNKTYSKLAALAAVVAVGGVGIFGFLLPRLAGDDRFAACRQTTVAAGGDPFGGPFTLTSETGARVSDTDVITKPTLLYFGYTYCPDVCPIDSARTAEAVELLREQGRDVGHVFISFDPKRDTPETLAEFTSYFDDDMLGLTGTEEEIAALARAYRVFYKTNGDDPEDYLMDHSTVTYLQFPEHGVVDFINRATPANEIAKTVACFMDAA